MVIPAKYTFVTSNFGQLIVLHKKLICPSDLCRHMDIDIYPIDTSSTEKKTVCVLIADQQTKDNLITAEVMGDFLGMVR